jgi:hypothetical protein
LRSAFRSFMPGYGALLPSRLCNFEHPFTIKTGHCGIQFRPLRGKPASTSRTIVGQRPTNCD